MIATKTTTQFSLDLKNWFSEEQFLKVAYISKNGQQILTNVKLQNIDFKGIIWLIQNGEVYCIDSKRITAIDCEERRADGIHPKFATKEPQNNLLTTCEIKGISLDLTEWYFEGQQVSIDTNGRRYEEVIISHIDDLFGNAVVDIKYKDDIVEIPADTIESIEYIERRILMCS